ncbi:MAG TPA: polyprenyl synthetase family protein [Acidimicrobiales bacterium]|nr:polyprenyl synthetase family protein [Acidimicrobiales bacterium]
MTTAPPVPSVESVLARYGRMTAEALLAYLPDQEPRQHLWDLVVDYPSRGGKAIRPSLCLASCVAFGGELDEALPSAVAIELLHNAFLVHDDVEDGSQLRRGSPTLHERHGVPLAVNAGDALVLLAAAPLRDNRDRLGARMAAAVADEFDRMARHTVEGQAVELGWRRDAAVELTPDDYLDLIMRKTCWYTTVHPLRVGALIGSWGRADLDLLVRFGFYLGAAFQIRDDLLNLVGDEATYGKEVHGDLYEGKRTLMLNHVLAASSGAEQDELVHYLRLDRTQRTADDVELVLAAMQRHGSLEFAADFARGIAGAAHGAFEEAFAGVPDGEDRRFIEAMIPWMLERRA